MFCFVFFICSIDACAAGRECKQIHHGQYMHIGLLVLSKEPQRIRSSEIYEQYRYTKARECSTIFTCKLKVVNKVGLYTHTCSRCWLARGLASRDVGYSTSLGVNTCLNVTQFWLIHYKWVSVI